MPGVNHHRNLTGKSTGLHNDFFFFFLKYIRTSIRSALKCKPSCTFDSSFKRVISPKLQKKNQYFLIQLYCYRPIHQMVWILWCQIFSHQSMSPLQPPQNKREWWKFIYDAHMLKNIYAASCSRNNVLLKNKVIHKVYCQQSSLELLSTEEVFFL